VKDLISGWLTSLGENPVLEGHRFSRAVNDTAIPGYLAAASIIR
jgi:hypothetical protein